MKSLNRVVRYHRWLRDIALPQESASTNAFSTATQLDRTTAGRRVLAAWLPFIFVTRTVMCAAKDERHQSEPGGKHLPGRSSPPRLRCKHALSVASRSKQGHAVPAGTACLLRRLNRNRRCMVRFPDCQSRKF